MSVFQLFLITLIVITGCTESTKPDSGKAKECLAGELDRWMARQEHKATHVESIGTILLDYEIKSLTPTEPTFLDHLPNWEPGNPPPVFLATVQIQIESRAGTPITKVILYRLAWDRDKENWNIRYTMTGT